MKVRARSRSELAAHSSSHHAGRLWRGEFARGAGAGGEGGAPGRGGGGGGGRKKSLFLSLLSGSSSETPLARPTAGTGVLIRPFCHVHTRQTRWTPPVSDDEYENEEDEKDEVDEDEEVEDMDEIYAESRFPAGFLPMRMCRWYAVTVSGAGRIIFQAVERLQFLTWAEFFFYEKQFCRCAVSHVYTFINTDKFNHFWKVRCLEQYTSWKVRVPKLEKCCISIYLFSFSVSVCVCCVCWCAWSASCLCFSLYLEQAQ